MQRNLKLVEYDEFNEITVGQESVDLALVKIGNADALCEPSVDKLLERLPRIKPICVALKEKTVRVDWKKTFAFLVRHGPVNQVQIQEIQL